MYLHGSEIFPRQEKQEHGMRATRSFHSLRLAVVGSRSPAASWNAIVPLIGGMSGIFIRAVWTTCKYCFASLSHSHISSVPYPKNRFVTVKVDFSRIFGSLLRSKSSHANLSQRVCRGRDGVSQSKPMHCGDGGSSNHFSCNTWISLPNIISSRPSTMLLACCDSSGPSTTLLGRCEDADTGGRPRFLPLSDGVT